MRPAEGVPHPIDREFLQAGQMLAAVVRALLVIARAAV
jgi:hypothetical protein